MSATGAVRVGTHRTGTIRTGTSRSGTHRTGVVRGGAGRTTSARSVPARPDLRLVPPSAPTRSRRTRSRSARAPFVLLVLALLVGTTLSLLVLNTAIAVDSLKATTLRQDNAKRAQEVQRLQQQVVEGSTPQRLAGEATAAGLVPAGTAGYLVVEPDGTTTLRGTPVPAPAPPPPAPAPSVGPSVDPAGAPAAGNRP